LLFLENKIEDAVIDDFEKKVLLLVEGDAVLTRAESYVVHIYNHRILRDVK
jgi:hypothetical protein